MHLITSPSSYTQCGVLPTSWENVVPFRSLNAFAQRVCSTRLLASPPFVPRLAPLVHPTTCLLATSFAHYRFTPLAPPVSSPTRAPSTFRYPLPTPFIRRAAASPPRLRCALLPRIHLHPSLPPLHCFHLSSTCYPRVTRSFGYALIGLAHTPHPRFTCLRPYSAPFFIRLLFIGRTPSSFSLQSSAWRSPNSPT